MQEDEVTDRQVLLAIFEQVQTIKNVLLFFTALVLVSAAIAIFEALSAA